MKILAIDIETKPTVAYVWRPYKENVGVDQVISPGGLFTWAAQWYGEDKCMFSSEWGDGRAKMLERVWDLLDEADVVLHFNGRKFDIPHIQREFMEWGFPPPSPYKQIDLLECVRKQARFFMNRLAHVAPQLGLKGKLEHEGFPLWVKCIEGDKGAQKRMEAYNKRDVTELIEFYDIIKPWITSHPSVAAFTGEHVCPKCGGEKLEKRGFAYTAQTKFQRYLCQSCGAWSRSTTDGERVRIAQITNN